ncbi:hypothetical protein Ae201684P_020208 [Aphanomyces euteiches]|nr:hypothetical protein Ae201684P_020208 [Aphanomyces euteiches]
MVDVDMLGDGLSDAVEHFASDNEDCGALKDKNAVKVPSRATTNSRAMDIKDLYRRKTTPIDLQSLFDKDITYEKPENEDRYIYFRHAHDQLNSLVATADHLYNAASLRSKHFLALQKARYYIQNNRDLKGIFKQGSVNWIRSKETLNERDDLAELRRLKDDLRDGAPAPSSRINRPDLDANSLRSNLKASGIKNSLSESSIASTRRNSVASSALPSPVKTASNIQALRASQHRQAIKRTTRIIGEDGTESVKIEFIIDPKRVDLFVSAQKFKEQQQNDKESNQLQKRKSWRMLSMTEILSKCFMTRKGGSDLGHREYHCQEPR